MKILKCLCIGLFFCSIYTSSAQQITTNNSQSLEALIQANLGQGCVEISNVSSSVNGQFNSINSFGSFDKSNSNFPFQNGIVLSTGSISSAGNGVNTNTLNEGNPNWPTDTDLENTLGISGTLNATSIEFDFVSAANQIAFNYILASEEYNTNFPCLYSDGFAFLIKQAGTADPYTNIALIPGTTIPVNTNTIHDEIVGFCPAENGIYFEGYNIGDTNYNGRTSVLTARADIQPNILYNIKLIIADQTDQNYDSAVFIQGTSTIASVDLGPDISTCGDSYLLNGDVENPLAAYQWFRDGIAISGATNTTYNATISGTYRIEVSIQINSSSCVIDDEIVVSLSSEQSVPDLTDFVLCDDASGDGIETFDLTLKDGEALGIVPPGNYEVSYHLTNVGAITETATITTSWQNTSNPQTIYVRIEDLDSGCLAFTTFNLLVNELPEYGEPTDIEICDDEVVDGIVEIDLSPTVDEITSVNPNLSVSFHSIINDAETGNNPIASPYFNTNPAETLFIRMQDSSTGCINFTTVSITVLENPELNPDIQWLNACEVDGDGFEIFDLSTVVDDVLQGLNGVSFEFYEFEITAIDETDPILDITSYENVVPFFQLVYIRVTNDTTGCFSIMPVELHTNVVQTGFSTSNFGVCDDPSNDGIAEFDLAIIEVTLMSGYEGFTLFFFETEADQLNNINPIDISTLYTVTNIVTELYVTAVDQNNCIDYTTVELIINPAIEIQDLETVEYCDIDFDGSTSILLETFDDYVGTGIDFSNTRYFLTEVDAINGENALDIEFTNTSNPITIYVRVTNSQTKCFDISPLEILVIDPPVVMQPTDVVICDNDQDGLFNINLESKIPEIVIAQTDLIFSFHNEFDDADFGINAISNPDNFLSSTQTIFVRIENQITTCHSIVDFEVIVNTLPVFLPISDFITCENDGDEINDFFLNLKDDEILNGQLDKQTLYFETEQDAIDRNNSIDKSAAYQNLSNPQTIYVRVENLTDPNCFGTSSLILSVLPFPQFNIPVDVEKCDDNTNDGFEVFDLSQKITEISSGVTESLDISFHLSLSDADQDLNELPLNFTNTINPQPIFARIENGTFCYSVTDFNIGVIQVPEVNSAPDLISCDDDYDGFTNFDLNEVETDVLDIRQDDVIITYHETLISTETDSDLILDPENYINISNPQIVYIKITNSISNCSSVLPINLIVNLPPLINDFGTYGICLNASSSFDLNVINDVLLVDDTDVIINYYSSFANAQSSSNELNTNYTYTTFSDTIYARVEYFTTGCFYIYPFQLIVNQPPIANQPPDLQICDDVSNDDIEEFNLFIVNDAVIGNQNSNEFTVTYFNSEAAANSGNNPLTYNYSGQNGETIYARIENNTTGCFSLTQFNLIVNDHPNVPSILVNCDTDYDGQTLFDLTSAEQDLFSSVNPDNIISYFESIGDLQNDTNAISNPTNYTNLFSPQTVYVKVFNTVANCFSFVPLGLDVNLPPAIDALNEFELCTDNNGMVMLSDINSPLLIQTANVLVQYYATETDALNQTSPLDNDYQYQSTSDTIFARIEFSTTHCYYIHEFNLIVNPLPIANQPNNLIECDDDYDSLYTFDLSSQDTLVLDGQNPNEFVITYHNDFLSAEDNNDSLNEIYEAFNGETIYVRIENNSTGCYDITSFEVTIHPKPIIDIGPQVICLENSPLLVSANTNQVGDTYLWSTNQTTPEIEISDIGTYSVTITSPFGCETTEVFVVTESEAANIVVTETIDFSDPNSVTVTVNGIGNYLYQLEDDDVTNDYDDYPPQISNVFENVSLGYHTLTVIDLNGCAIVRKEIVIIDAPKFMTPNDDGHFDTWHISGVETIPGTIIYIFDRYGKLLKTLTSNSRGWNGYYNGSLMPVSDYWYLAKVKKDGKSFEVKGHFSLRY